MNKLDTLLTRITDPKERKLNKITRSSKHVIGDVQVRYPDGAMTADKRLLSWFKFGGGSGVVKVIGLKGLVESKDRPSTTYALGKYIPHFGSVVGVGQSKKTCAKGQNRLMARVERRP